jgi:hypothetical protein
MAQTCKSHIHLTAVVYIRQSRYRGNSLVDRVTDQIMEENIWKAVGMEEITHRARNFTFYSLQINPSG